MTTTGYDDAVRELLRRRRARASLVGFAQAIEIPGKPLGDEDELDPDAWLFRPVETGLAAHHRLMLEALERTAGTRHGRLMIMMPPGSAKSTFASVVSPVALMGRTPGYRVLLASYGQDLARRHGRRARAVAMQRVFSDIYSGHGDNPQHVTIAPGSSAADEWALTNGSEYLACGVLASVTGNRANFLIIDDPTRGREQADSPTLRQKTWDAYQDDLLTRLVPGGAVALVSCLVGDTQVLMGDGTEKAIRDIRPGDKVGSYHAGRIVCAKVLNWANQGPDCCYTIRTRNGLAVTANGRHPFLVERDGELRWVELGSLKASERILSAIGGSGAASSVLTTNASSRPKSKGCAIPTTTSGDGPLALERHRSTRRGSRLGACVTAMASVLTSMLRSARSKVVDALSATSCRVRTFGLTGAASCAWITAMTPELSGACSATIATSSSATASPSESCSRPLDTFAIAFDEVVSISSASREDVYDVQVEGTESFVANGLICHNTRWHEDDLAGRILPKNYEGQSGLLDCRDGKVWEVLSLPACCERLDDPLGRAVGEYLWPEWFDLGHWAIFRAQSRTWASLFQQRPRPEEGGVFKAAWFVRYEMAPLEGITVQSWDTANKKKADNAPSVCTTWRITRHGYYLLHVYRERLEYPALKRTVISQHLAFRPDAILIEDKASGQSLIQDLREEAMLPVIAIEPEGDKLTRARRCSGLVEAGLVHVPAAAPWLPEFESEVFAFPWSTFADQIDSSTQFLNWARESAVSVTAIGADLERAGVTAFDDEIGHPSRMDAFGEVGRLRSSTDTRGF